MDLQSKFLIWMFTMFCCCQANADWAAPGIAYRCDKGASTFTFVATMATSDPVPGTIDVPKSYHALLGGETIKCSLNGQKLQAKVFIREYRVQGICGAAGGVIISQLMVNGRSVMKDKDFNYYCFNPDSYYRIKISVQARNIAITGCHATWDWDVGYKEVYCDDEKITADSGLAFKHGWETTYSPDSAVCSVVFDQLRRKVFPPGGYDNKHELVSRLDACTRSVVFGMSGFELPHWEVVKLEDHKELALSMLLQNFLGPERFFTRLKDDLHNPEESGQEYYIEQVKRLEELIVQRNELMLTRNSLDKYYDYGQRHVVAEDQLIAMIPYAAGTLPAHEGMCPEVNLKSYPTGVLSYVKTDLSGVDGSRVKRGGVYGELMVQNNELYLISAGSTKVYIERKGDSSPVSECQIEYK